MSAVAPANSTVSFIRRKVRRLTASANESALSTADLDQYLNNFYMNDFAYGIKIDQMRSVYTFLRSHTLIDIPWMLISIKALELLFT